TYRAWHEFHISSLGRDWHRIVEAWDEDCRADFIGEVAQQRQAAEIAEHLALTDPSGKVRLVAVQALFFSSAVERLRRVLSSLDDPTFREIVRKGMLDRASADLRPRVLSAYKVILDQTEDSFARLRIVLAMTGLGEPGAPRVVLAELSRIPPARIPH